jgi:SAM-dependent methyltransferase
MEPLYEQRGVPVHSCLLIDDRAEALAFPRGDLALALCRRCGFISNLAFDAAMNDYSAKYEETQGFSPRFRQFAESLANRLIGRYDLHGKRVLEIGCGKGEFLVLLCELGKNHGTGFDPTYVSERTRSEAASRIEFVTDLFSEKYAHVPADFICCRHTLEHIAPVREFVSMLRRAIGTRDTIVFFELPDVGRILRELAFWDVYYEHCSYFSLGSLARLFRGCGFDVLDLYLEYGDQYVMIEARPAPRPTTASLPQEDDLAQVLRDADHFRRHCDEKISSWKKSVGEIAGAGRRVCLWGSGSKAVAYLTTMGVEREIEYVVDINPFKHGMYLAGTGQKIVAPAFLRELRPDVVIAMNPIYRAEIQRDLDTLGVKAELLAV